MDSDTRAFFGLKQMPLFPELEVTQEEEGVFNALSRQVGGSHYKRAIQPWDIISEWKMNSWAGNVIKYLLRYPHKAGKEDLEKARHYLDYLIENYEELHASE